MTLAMESVGRATEEGVAFADDDAQAIVSKEGGAAKAANAATDNNDVCCLCGHRGSESVRKRARTKIIVCLGRRGGGCLGRGVRLGDRLLMRSRQSASPREEVESLMPVSQSSRS